MIPPACGASAPSEDAVDQELSRSPLGRGGLYVLISDAAASNTFWLNKLNLHADGTFEADFGGSVSNLHGGRWFGAGTYRSKKNAGAWTLQLTDVAGDPARSHSASRWNKGRFACRGKIRMGRLTPPRSR